MAKKILEEVNYLFDASAKTVTFTPEFGDVTLQNLLLVTNVTDNIVIYNFACEGFGGTIGNRTLTLDYDTTSMSDTDDIQVIMELVEENSEIYLKGIEKSNKDLTTIIELLEDQNELLRQMF